jgi:hypothetical protein
MWATHEPKDCKAKQGGFKKPKTGKKDKKPDQPTAHPDALAFTRALISFANTNGSNIDDDDASC